EHRVDGAGRRRAGAIRAARAAGLLARRVGFGRNEAQGGGRGVGGRHACDRRRGGLASAEEEVGERVVFTGELRSGVRRAVRGERAHAWAPGASVERVSTGSDARTTTTLFTSPKALVAVSGLCGSACQRPSTISRYWRRPGGSWSVATCALIAGSKVIGAAAGDQLLK